MSSFEERKLTISPTCSKCKHCMVSEVENDEGDAYSDLFAPVYHCMLGVSKEDRKFVEKEIDNYEGCPYDVSFTDKFNQIMEMKSKDRDCQQLDESSRSVRSNNCCQFFERKKK